MPSQDPFNDDLDEDSAPADPDQEPLILIVVGAHLRAEVGDRPLAYGVQRAVVRWLRAKFPPPADAALESDDTDDDDDNHSGLPCGVLVCTDVLYLNDAGLRVWPTISVGGPGVNALSAVLGDKLPSVLVIDDVLMIQMDPEFEQLTAAVWGINHAATVDAVNAFLERYLDSFLGAATKGWSQG